MQRPHLKQFIISKSEQKIYDDWICIKFSNHFYLSHCPFAQVHLMHDANQKQWILIGEPTLIVNDFENLDMFINSLQSEQIIEATRYWGGRWILFSDSEIVTDASSLLGLFLHIESQIISSSPVLVHQIISNSTNNLISLSTSYYFNWFLVPGTACPTIRKLLLSQKIIFNLIGFEIDNKQIIFPELKIKDYTVLFEKFEQAIKNEMLFISKKYRVHVALSGGYDSRLIYSVANTTLKSDFSSYTHLYPSMVLSDKYIPEQFAINHRSIQRSKFKKEKLELIDKHSGKHVLDADRLFFAYQQWDSFGEQDTCIRGSILELAGKSSAHLYDKVPELNHDEYDANLILWAMNDFREFQLHALKEYFEVVNTNEHFEIDAMKRFYWEQRVGGWLSYIEQSLDILPCKSFQICNSLYVINLFLQIPPSLMKVKSLHVDFMRKHTPELLNYPFNFINMKDRIRQFIKIKADKFIHASKVYE